MYVRFVVSLGLSQFLTGDFARSGVFEPRAGVPISLNGVIVPEGGAAIAAPSGLDGMILAGTPGMWMRLASLL